MKKPKKYDNEEIKQYREQGLTPKQIGIVYGVSGHKISNYIYTLAKRKGIYI